MFRFHLDIPLGNDEDTAIEISKQIAMVIQEAMRSYHANTGISINCPTSYGYRLGNDQDRQKSNYLDKNDNGHVSNKKIIVDI